MTMMSSQFLELNMYPVEIRPGSYLSDTKMAECAAGFTFIEFRGVEYTSYTFIHS